MKTSLLTYRPYYDETLLTFLLRLKIMQEYQLCPRVYEIMLVVCWNLGSYKSHKTFLSRESFIFSFCSLSPTVWEKVFYSDCSKLWCHLRSRDFISLSQKSWCIEHVEDDGVLLVVILKWNTDKRGGKILTGYSQQRLMKPQRKALATKQQKIRPRNLPGAGEQQSSDVTASSSLL